MEVFPIIRKNVDKNANNTWYNIYDRFVGLLK